MTHSPTFTIKDANTPQYLMGAISNTYCLMIRAASTNTSSLFFGDMHGDINNELAPGSVATFNAGECDLADEWAIKGATAGDKYTIQIIDISQWQKRRLVSEL